MLHKIPEYPVQTDREGCCDKLRFLGERKAGLQELWNELGENSAVVQTMQRRMMLQLGFLAREGRVHPHRSGLEQPDQRRDESGVPGGQP
jgi:hypothetical protein